jgi:hypothetical protein
MKLTNKLLRRIIEEEVEKFGDMDTTESRAKDADELDADEFGSDKSLENKIDYMKALKIEETRLRRRLMKITETRRRISRSI